MWWLLTLTIFHHYSIKTRPFESCCDSPIMRLLREENMPQPTYSYTLSSSPRAQYCTSGNWGYNSEKQVWVTNSKITNSSSAQESSPKLNKQASEVIQPWGEGMLICLSSSLFTCPIYFHNCGCTASVEKLPKEVCFKEKKKKQHYRNDSHNNLE